MPFDRPSPEVYGFSISPTKVHVDESSYKYILLCELFHSNSYLCVFFCFLLVSCRAVSGAPFNRPPTEIYDSANQPTHRTQCDTQGDFSYNLAAQVREFLATAILFFISAPCCLC